MIEPSSLTQAITELTNLVIAQTQSIKKSGKINYNTNYNTFAKFESLDYDATTGGLNCSFHYETQPSEEPDPKVIYSIILSTVKQFEKYTIVRKQISAYNGVNESQSDLWLGQFVVKVIYAVLQDDSEWPKHVQKLQDVFLNDLEDAPLEWHIKVYLSGIVMRVPELNLNDNVKIRRATAEDFEELSKKDLPLFIYATYKNFLLNDFSTILEVNTTGTSKEVRPPAFPEVNKLISTLQLFRKGSVRTVYTTFDANTITRIFGSGYAYSTHQFFPSRYAYQLSEEDGEKLRAFITKIKDRISLDLYGQILASDFIGIALARYQDSILRIESFSNRISYAVMGLEALFLGGGENGEFSYRLAQRVSKLVSTITGENALEIFNNMNKAYEIRSSFVHGSVSSKNGPEEGRIFEKVSEYLRESIIAFFMLERVTKKDIIHSLGESLLDKDKEKELRQIIDKHQLNELVKL
ncbi:MAG: hypothetical protein JRN26_04315 [Nitrososphaerota archaeon]|nr:HEPN domain-containing protein [Nitrososphaerota archaeon]MDG6932541.1 hypothetical protein [Nitrososphaerota archaeon]MDG6936088.1 hypothetical protein [Nitrososphaerota archaeon]MDG6944524.1 hypothetical protein [Nitrososphaerota archaeon]